MGTTTCIEPNYKNLYVKSNLSGDFIVLNRELVLDFNSPNRWTQLMVEILNCFKGEKHRRLVGVLDERSGARRVRGCEAAPNQLEDIETIPEELKQKHKTVFSVGFEYIIDAAARRQKWIDQSQSVNLFLAQPDMKNLSHMYRRAWEKGLKTTYYLRTLQASDIESSTGKKIDKDIRGVMGGGGAAPAKVYTEAEKNACSIDAMINGGECEACQ